MFLALRELRFARGRFGLMGLVIALMAVLMVMLSGLSAGLVNDGVSGLKSMPVTAFAFDEGTREDNAFSRSVVDAEQVAVWRDHPDVAAAEPMGVSIVNAETADGRQIDLTLFGVEPGTFLEPEVGEGEGLGDDPAGIVVSATARDEGLELGTVVTLDRIGTELEVVGFTEGQATFGHVDIAYVPLRTWQLIAGGDAPAARPTADDLAALDSDRASVVALQAVEGSAIARGDAKLLAAAGAQASTTTMSLEESFNASPGYTAETLTLQMIQWFLYVIGALVVGAFFTVWTIQRGHELAVLRAMGASVRYLLGDALAQAAILLVTFTLAGLAVGLGLGALMPDGMPFSLEAGPIAAASAATVLLALLGAAVAVLRIARIEPLAALGGAR